MDCASYNKMVPNATCSVSNRVRILDEVPQTEIHFCAPTILGYSFSAKQWGRLIPDKFSPVVWNMHAFDHLVLSRPQKSLIEALMKENKACMVEDVVVSKGGGHVVVLHGNPGTGKTLTVEAAAERGNKPLMVLSAAEMGNHAYEVEKNLPKVLELCKTWKAVLLLDEADMFLEKRQLGDVYRNAMVGVFLHLLEYHQELVFLTTNRLTRLDPAFKSRISVAIKYPDLDQKAQEQIWTNFLRMVGVRIDEQYEGLEEESSITNFDVSRLAMRKLNGRYSLKVTTTNQ